jgi:hypothetical protein
VNIAGRTDMSCVGLVNDSIVEVDDGKVLISVRDTNSNAMLTITKDSCKYTKSTPQSTTISEIATLNDIPVIPTVITDDDTIKGDGTNANPISLKKIYVNASITGDGTKDNPLGTSGATEEWVENNFVAQKVENTSITNNGNIIMMYDNGEEPSKNMSLDDSGFSFRGYVGINGNLHVDEELDTNSLRINEGNISVTNGDITIYRQHALSLGNSDDIQWQWFFDERLTLSYRDPTQSSDWKLALGLSYTDKTNLEIAGNITMKTKNAINFLFSKGAYSLYTDQDDKLYLYYVSASTYPIVTTYIDEEENTVIDFNGNIYAWNISSMTVTHKTNVKDVANEQAQLRIGRFCETTGELYDYERGIKITDCICKVKLSTALNTKVLGIITSEDSFASHGDVLVVVDDGEYHLGDLLIPTQTGARIATEDEKLFIMINGLPRVRITCIDGRSLPLISERACVACFIA